MIKEIVEFSRELESAGIYERVTEENKKIDKPIMVIPVDEELTQILTDDIYFVFKAVENEFCILDESNGKEKRVEVKQPENSKIKIKAIQEESVQWREILKSIPIITRKLKGDEKGGKSIGSNKGTNSYHILIFEGKFKDGGISNKKGKKVFKGDLFNCDFGFFQKLSDTYRKENIIKGIPTSSERGTLISLLEQVALEDNRTQIWRQIELFKNCFVSSNLQNKVQTASFDSLRIIIMLPQKYYPDYSAWYSDYIKKKIFVVEKESDYFNGECPICKASNKKLFLPNSFNNMDEGKPFLKHLHRYRNINIAICKDCALSIYKFQEYFLVRLHMTIFPLFTVKELRVNALTLFQNQQRIKKQSFKRIIDEIYRKTSIDTLDFILMLYKDDILFFDYITGFQYKFNDINLFEIEKKFNEIFFDSYLLENYFTSKVDTKERNRDRMIYRYRKQLFDFFYRAKYRGIDKAFLRDMYFEVLKIEIGQLVSGAKSYNKLVSNHKKYLELNTIFKGEMMETIKAIKDKKRIEDLESFAFYAGQISYYLLSQSKAEQKKHSLIEPFVNVVNFRILGKQIENLFNTYKHSIDFGSHRFNAMMSGFWAFLYDHNDEEFTNDLKILFYAGYFDRENNIFFERRSNDGGK